MERIGGGEHRSVAGRGKGDQREEICRRRRTGGSVACRDGTSNHRSAVFVVHLLKLPKEKTSRWSSGNTGVGVLDRQTYRGGTRGSRLCGGDRDRETENSKVCARTRDTRFIQVRVAKVASPTSCLGNKYGALRLVLVVPGGIGDVRLGTRPSLI
jgi:hypothetical protein